MDKWIQIKKGLKQGNPFSPLVFILVTDTLHHMLDLSLLEKLIELVGPANLSSMMHLAQYTDDTTLFCIASKCQLNSLKLILYFFKLLTSLKRNFSKSYIMGPGLQLQEVQGYTAILGCKSTMFPIQYLGIALHFKTLLVSNWNFVISKVEHKLSG